MLPNPSRASSWDWVVSGTANWNDGSNWNPAIPPDVSGTATIANSGTAVVNAQAIYRELDMGDGGLLLSGGSLSGTKTYLGVGVGATVATVTGGTWTTGDFILGQTGSAALNISAGLVSVSGTFRSGATPGSTGSLVLTGSSANRGTLSVTKLVASSSTSSLTLNGGILQARADEDDFLSGYASNKIALGAGGVLVDTNGHDVGIQQSLSGNSSFTKTGAGTLHVEYVALTGQFAVNTGTVVVRSGGLQASTVIVGGPLGNGSLSIEDADVSASTIHLGVGSEASGSLSISEFSRVSTSNFALGNGALEIDGGELAVQGISTIGTGGPATVLMNKGVWSTRDMQLVAGSLGPLSFDMTGGLLNVTTGPLLILGYSTLNLTGGTIRARTITVGSGTVVKMNFDGGTLAAVANTGSFLSAGGPDSLNILEGGLFVNSGSFSIGILGALSGTGGLTKLGNGTLALTGTNTFQGGADLLSGTLSLGSASALGTSGTIAFNGGALQFGASNTTDYSARFSRADGQQFRVDTNGQSVTLASSLASTGGTFTKLGAGALTLSGSNGYTGGTFVNSGTLVAASDFAVGAGAVTVEGGVFLLTAGVDVPNDIILSGGGLSRSLTAGSNLAGTMDAASQLAGGTRDTSASILQGSLSVSGTVVTSFSGTSSAGNDELRVSDIYHLNGIGSDLFVLELSVAGLEKDVMLGWKDGSDLWVNAVAGNIENNAALAQQGFEGSFRDFQLDYGSNLSSYVGAWGIDVSAGRTSVWAVVNHNSEFAIIPEPSAAVLAAFTFGVMLLRRKR